jgi:serine protease
MKGVAQNCTVMSVRVLGECRTGYASDVADAIVWAAGREIVDVNLTETPARIIMMAFSGYGTCPGYLQSAVTQATNLRAVLIAAAGNNAKDASLYFPGNCEGTVVVAASTRQGTLATYSNFGPMVDVAAPGGYWCHGSRG